MARSGSRPTARIMSCCPLLSCFTSRVTNGLLEGLTSLCSPQNPRPEGSAPPARWRWSSTCCAASSTSACLRRSHHPSTRSSEEPDNLGQFADDVFHALGDVFGFSLEQQNRGSSGNLYTDGYEMEIMQDFGDTSRGYLSVTVDRSASTGPGQGDVEDLNITLNLRWAIVQRPTRRAPFWGRVAVGARALRSMVDECRGRPRSPSLASRPSPRGGCGRTRDAPSPRDAPASLGHGSRGTKFIVHRAMGRTARTTRALTGTRAGHVARGRPGVRQRCSPLRPRTQERATSSPVRQRCR